MKTGRQTCCMNPCHVVDGGGFVFCLFRPPAILDVFRHNCKNETYLEERTQISPPGNGVAHGPIKHVLLPGIYARLRPTEINRRGH